MVVMKINLSGDGAWPDLADKLERGKVIHLGEGSALGVSALAGGMQSGAPSVMIRFDLPDGRTVLAEMSLRLFLAAADALRARYGSGGE
jgi:hypothetical protein